VEHYDVAIIGGGIVGLSTARALIARRPGLRVVVLEKETGLAQHQTGHNSGVIHSGVYYAPGSQKARYAVSGATAMYQFCAEFGLPVRRSGKIIVATAEKELPRLAELERRGRANGVAVQRLSPAELAEREPHVRAIAALHVPITGVVDFSAVARQYATLATDGGAVLKVGTQVVGVRDDATGVTLELDRGESVTAATLVNCAGLFSDRIAALAGVSPPVRILPFRGEYFLLEPHAASLVRDLIYPVPDPLFPFLGVHLTRGIDDAVHAGPNAVLAFSREGYRATQFRRRDLAEVTGYRGFWRLARHNWRAAIAEYSGSLSKQVFAARICRMLPDVTARDLQRGPAGVRAQAVGQDGRLVDDFLLVETARALHVLNAPSPAATASIPIGNHLAERTLQRVDAA
jgi:L-2-hydroxyglutarate oxidase